MATTVETRRGRLRSRVEGSVHAFRGVPYASPPIGERRFRRPSPPPPWSGIRGPWLAAAAPEPEGALAAELQPRHPQAAEDCLYLDIWTPAVEGAPRPVVVWLQGGGLTGGRNCPFQIDGRRLARRGDLVVVAVRYRIGALGFLHVPEAELAGVLDAPNLGLWDVCAALDWIRDEIDAFGGDPANLTLIGSSAAGASVAALLCSARERPRFRRAIVQSAFLALPGRSQAARLGRTLLDRLGLQPASAHHLREVELDTLLTAQRDCEGRSPDTTLWGSAFRPIVDHDLVPLPPLQAVAAGSAGGIPLLVGCTRDELSLLRVTAPESTPTDTASLRAALGEQLARNHPAGQEQARRVLELYASTLYGPTRVDPAALWTAIQSDRTVRHPASRLAALQSVHEPRTFVYDFRWSSGARLQGIPLGAFHGVEVPFLFGTLEHHGLGPILCKSPQTTALARSLQDAWTAFARHGDPSHPTLGSWPRYAPPQRTTMVLASRTHLEEDPGAARRQLWDELQGPASTPH